MQYYAPKQKKRKKTKKLSVPALVSLDIGLIGLSLVVFALFHHVLPSYGGEDLSKGQFRTPPPVSAGGTANPDATADPNATGTPVDPSDWGAKFADKFTDGEVIKTENSYKSKDINVTVTKVQKDGVTYFVQDIYIRKIQNLQTGFAKDKYGRGYNENTLEMAKRNQAVCAINGDYYSFHSDTGVVIRNGYLYRSNPTEDVCVLFYDGRMESFPKENFYGDQVLDDGAYQAWCFGPVLVKNGKALEEFNSAVRKANPRSGIGYYEPGHYCFVTVDGRQDGYSKGMTLTEYAKVFEELGCKEAYNLDGGQSAVMTFGDKVANQPYNGGRSCSDIVLIREWEDG